MVVSLEERDAPGKAVQGAQALSALIATLQAAGLSIACGEATAADVEGSSWAKRLGIPRSRTAWVLEARKP